MTGDNFECVFILVVHDQGDLDNVTVMTVRSHCGQSYKFYSYDCILYSDPSR